ncbi:hypothetical protein GGI25_001560 [Coemansia spiralis]|uniref:CHY-type domain-containing protein n=2 Tax=Coemansia TaxID=4863 RepID=A0A9W8GAT9_9FUNG|nr:hypothetical protein EDC05_002062 [Coemansia umbellata]KAJ2622962.1 hypothetical protein GGI26_002763 [Coemansia sp. RSA 1358]KAJ2679425.1 hypothetical protein GGI25_001560 [Coemansia spiralis]
MTNGAKGATGVDTAVADNSAQISVDASEASTSAAQAQKTATRTPRQAYKKPTICRYFQQGNGCRAGDECRFLHTTMLSSAEGTNTASNGNSTNPSDRSRIKTKDQAKGTDKGSSRGRDKKNKKGAQTNDSFRKAQIEGLLRVPNWVVKRLSSERGETAFAIEMKPFDPDFPYDVSRVYMALIVPSGYPTMRSSDPIVAIQIANKNIPAGVKHNIETGFAKYVRKTTNAAIEAGNPENVPSLEGYINWLDRNLELLMQQKPATTIKFTTFSGFSAKQGSLEKQPPQPRSPASPSSSSNTTNLNNKPAARALLASRPPVRKPVSKPTLPGADTANIAAESESTGNSQRLMELRQLERRFRSSYKVLQEDPQEGTTISIDIVPTDPDMSSLDISQMTGTIFVSSDYPKLSQQNESENQTSQPSALFTIDPNSILGHKGRQSTWYPAEGRQVYLDYISKRFSEHVVEAPNTSLLHHLNWLDRWIASIILAPLPPGCTQSQPQPQPQPQTILVAPDQQQRPLGLPPAKSSLFKDELSETKPWIKTISLEEAGLSAGVHDLQISSESDSSSNNDSSSSEAIDDKNNDGLQSSGNDIVSGGGLSKPIRRGTEIRFGIIKLVNILLAHCHSLNINVRCGRCKGSVELRGIAQTLCEGKDNQMWKACDTCAIILGVRFRPDWIFVDSTTLGYLDCSGCAPIDLLPSKYTLSCESCAINGDDYEADINNNAASTAESSEHATVNEGQKDTIVSVGIGSSLMTNCRRCYARLGITLQEPQFIRLQSGLALGGGSSTAQISKEVERTRKAKVNKREELARLGVVPGQPLPDHGACKHFRKSQRWLRFPCCGKAYPCVACHDDKEDHDHEYAQIMICGHCAKEQRISKAEHTGMCTSCGSQVVRKIDGNHAFWQGGTGVRDRTRMSRKDSKKYQGLGKTTASKKVATPKK